MIPHDAGLPDPSNQMPPGREPPPVAGRIDPPVISAVRTPPPPPSQVPPALSGAPDFQALLIGLRRRWISAVLIGGTLASLAAVGVYYLLTPKNTAFAKILVAAIDPVVLRDGNGGGAGEFKTFMTTAASQLLSRPVITKALASDEVKRLNLASREPDPVSWIEEEMKTVTTENNEVLTITLPNADPVVATTVLNAIKDTYLNDIYYTQLTARTRRITELERAYGEQEALLNAKKTSLTRIAKSLGGSDPKTLEAQRVDALSNLREAKSQLAQTNFRLVEAKSALEAIHTREKTVEALGTSADIESVLDADPEVKDIRSRMRKLEELYEDFRDKGCENYPTAVTALGRVKMLKRRIEERRVTLVEKLKKAPIATASGRSDSPAAAKAQLEKTISQLLEMQAELQKDIAEFTEKASRPQTPGPEYESLAKETERIEKTVSDLGNKVAREQLELKASPRITKFQDAELMKKDVRKQLLATVATPIAVMGAVCFGLAWLDVRQRRIRSAGMVSRGLGIRVVGAVPDMPGLERQVASPLGEVELGGTPVMESIDAIRTQLLHEADNHATRLVMVTSAVAGEGKTTLASHLASSLARAGRKTLLVDGDLRRPSIHELFEMPLQPGFSEVLLGEVEVTEAWQDATTDNLTVMTAGQWDREVLLALSRGGLVGVFEKFVEEFDFVIIDSHPVLAAADSLQIGRAVDAVILSVLREVSQAPKVYAAARKLQTLGIPVLGAVVNGTDPEEVFSAAATAAAQVA